MEMKRIIVTFIKKITPCYSVDVQAPKRSSCDKPCSFDSKWNEQWADTYKGTLPTVRIAIFTAREYPCLEIYMVIGRDSAGVSRSSGWFTAKCIRITRRSCIMAGARDSRESRASVGSWEVFGVSNRAAHHPSRIHHPSSLSLSLSHPSFVPFLANELAQLFTVVGSGN